MFSLKGGIGRVLLNRPAAINALTPGMIASLLDQLIVWSDDERVTGVELAGSGKRGLCAGADVRLLRQLVLDEPQAAKDFLETEYRLNALIAEWPKQWVSRLYGVTMGGGLGLSLHSRWRVARDDLRWAMPETTIGFFPDVGALFELSRLPSEAGTHLALTGDSIDAASALWAGLVDTVESDDAPASTQPWLAANASWMADCYRGESAAEIVQNLRAHPNRLANAAADVIESGSPLSVSVTLEAIRRASGMSSVAEVLAQDRVLAGNFVDASDFCEGVRAQLVDKDREPRWRHNNVADVSRDEVLAMFAD